MANFMKKVKPIKPVKPISEVKKDEKIIAAKEKIEQVKNYEPEEKIEETSEKSEDVIEITELPVETPPEPDPDSKEDDKLEDKTMEEIVEDTNKEPEPKPEKPKTKKKSNRKKKKEEPVEAKQNKEPVTLEKAENLMLETIMPCCEGWIEEKERVNGILDKIVITEELDPTSVKGLIADMSSALRELIMLSTEAKTALSNLKDTIEEIKVANSTGVNSEERKMNAMYAMKNYEKDEQVVDLTELLKFYRERQEFYDAAVRQIEINRQMLITFGSVFKLELAKAY